MEESSDGENAACCADSGWQPYHLAIVDDGQNLLALAPLYLKTHSYGEYVFDFAWADAYHRNGMEYYPKLLCAIPFTPATGPRLLVSPKIDDTEQKKVIFSFAITAIKQECQSENIQSAHILFPSLPETKLLSESSMMVRHSVQFHWFNKNLEKEKYKSFDQFLQELKARKRKAIKKERQQVAEQGLSIRRLTGEQLTEKVWKQFFLFYQRTYAKRSGHGGYLPQHFFRAMGEQLKDQIMMVVAYKKNGDTNELIAGALNFFSDDSLYGRYWGCVEEAEFLHFELCYYQGIEYCIENQLNMYDAGAQGEHKIQRGFLPVKTYSSHYVKDNQFAAAINNFIDREKDYNSEYINTIAKTLPYREDQNSTHIKA